MFRSSTILRELVWSLVKVTLYFRMHGTAMKIIIIDVILNNTIMEM
jgi:hypothetical protein